MASIKLKFLKSTNSLIVLLISILGFSSSCKKDEPRYMYGSPHADFIITGKVESAATNTPISEIIVEMRSIKDPPDEQSERTLVSTGFSYSGVGSYHLSDNFGFPKDQTYQIKFIDIDGPLNGEYETLDTTVVFKDIKFKDGDGSWDYGYTEQELNVKLKPKK
jgi:putative lipoprotein (rSAM/lipoprotein system)